MIYLDNAATSFPKPEPVYQALDRFARTSLANPGRAGHRMAVAAERMLDETRHRLNQFFGGEAPERWISDAELHRRTEPGHQGTHPGRGPRDHDRPGTQLGEPSVAGDREGGGDHPDENRVCGRVC